MTENRSPEDQTLLERVLLAQKLYHQLDTIETPMNVAASKPESAELHSLQKQHIRLKRQLSQAQNSLYICLSNDVRFAKLETFLNQKYGRNPDLWQMIWNQVMSDRWVWLLVCHSKKNPEAPPAFVQYEPEKASVWTWFSRDIEHRLIDKMRLKSFEAQSANTTSLEAPVAHRSGSNILTLGDVTPGADKPLTRAQQLVEIIRRDVDQIFDDKALRSGKATFKDIALRLAVGDQWKDIKRDYGACESSFYHWSEFYHPYLMESLEAQFWLPEAIAQRFHTEQQAFEKKCLASHPNISLRQIILWKHQEHCWQQLASKLLHPPVPTKEVILAFLRSIHKEQRKLQKT